MGDRRPSLVVITGPTASGKTALGIALALRHGGEIINADSVQIYRDFDIGSCKPGPAEQAAVRHHLLSVVNPDEDFNVGQYCRLVDVAAGDIDKRSRVPFLVGGSGLYIRSVLCGLVDVGEASPEILDELRNEEATLRASGCCPEDVACKMHEKLQTLDPTTASHIMSGDLVRIRRALAVKMMTGKSLALLQERHMNADRPYRALVIQLSPGRKELYRAIDSRVEDMLRMGLVEEVRYLSARYPLSSRPFAAIGYRHVLGFLRGEVTLPEMTETLKRDTRRFAKRQMTWWRNQPEKLGWRVMREPLVSEQRDLPRADMPDALSVIVGRFLERGGEFSEEGISYLSSVKGCGPVESL